MGKNIKLKKIIKKPLVTIYITNHNYGKYINKAIRSVLDQSLNEFELIIIDDGSTDNSLKIIDQYKNHRKIISVYQKNKGLTVSNNIALRLSRGKYIIRLDADDWLDPNALQIMSDYLEKNPQDAATRIAKRTKVTSEQILNAFKGLNQPNLQENQKLLDQTDPALVNGMKKLIQIMVENKLIPKAIDPVSILDDRFIKNANLSSQKNS